MAWSIPDKGEGIVIYALLDPMTLVCRYVGKTRRLKARLRAHMTESRGVCKNHRAKWIKSLGGERPALRILEVCNSETEANAGEIFWISEMRRHGCKLTNASDGGEGQSGFHHSEETKRRISETSRGHPVSLEVRACISAANKGMRYAAGFKHSEATKQKRREALLGKALFGGRRHSEETKAKMSAARSAYWRAKAAANGV